MTAERAPAVQAAPEPKAAATPARPVLESPFLGLQRVAVSSAGDPAETEAATVATAVAAGHRVSPLRARPRPRRIYRQTAEPGSAAGGLIAEDDAGAADPPRMRKREFLDALEESLCRAVEEGFEGTQYEGRGCPMVGEAIGFYRRLAAASLEASIRRYAPDTATVRSARDYIPVLTRRVATVLDTFVQTGRITGIPSELMPMAAMLLLRRTGGIGGLLTAALGGVLAGVGRAIGGAVRALFMHRSDPVGPAVDPRAVRADLGPGARLDGGVRARMERAFGHDFSSVRIHADARSGTVAESLGARAFTVGRDIAFARGEFRPGTIEGEALIAHELSHTVQQQGSQTESATIPGLEEEADASAAATVAMLWGEDVAKTGIAKPRRRMGLRLQRCSGRAPSEYTPSPDACTPITGRAWRDKAEIVEDAVESDDFDKMRTEGLPLVHSALCSSASGLRLVSAGEKDTAKESPEDYEPYPAVNFDPRLNKKEKYASGSLGANAGHSFTAGDPDSSGQKPRYLVLGPKVIDPDGPVTVRFWYEHERFHVLRHLTPARGAERREALEGLRGRQRSTAEQRLNADEEVQAHTDGFTRHFGEIGGVGVKRDRSIDARTGTFYVGYSGELFTQFVDAYEDANAAAQRAAIDALADYYESLPQHQGPSDWEGLTGRARVAKRNEDRRYVFEEWLRIRHRLRPNELLVTTLATRLRIDLETPREEYVR